MLDWFAPCVTSFVPLFVAIDQVAVKMIRLGAGPHALELRPAGVEAAGGP